MMILILMSVVMVFAVARTIGELVRDGYGSVPPPRSHEDELPPRHAITWS